MAVLSFAANGIHRRQFPTSSGPSSTNTTTIVIVVVVVVVVVFILIGIYLVRGRVPTVPQPVVKAPQVQRRTETNRGTPLLQSRYNDTESDWDPALRRVFEANPQSVMEQGLPQMALNAGSTQSGEQGEEVQENLNATRLRLEQDPEGVSSPQGDRGGRTGQQTRPIFFHRDAGEAVQEGDEDWPIEMPPRYESIVPSVQPRQ